jgi:hypothetical protein
MLSHRLQSLSSRWYGGNLGLFAVMHSSAFQWRVRVEAVVLRKSYSGTMLTDPPPAIRNFDGLCSFSTSLTSRLPKSTNNVRGWFGSSSFHHSLLPSRRHAGHAPTPATLVTPLVAVIQ